MRIAAATSAAILLIHPQQSQYNCDAFVVNVARSSASPLLKVQLEPIVGVWKSTPHQRRSLRSFALMSSLINNDSNVPLGGRSTSRMTTTVRKTSFVSNLFRTKRHQQKGTGAHADVDSSLSVSTVLTSVAFPMPQDYYTANHDITSTISFPSSHISSQRDNLDNDVQAHFSKHNIQQRRQRLERALPTKGVVNSITKSTFENILHSRLVHWSNGKNIGMEVQCHPSSVNNPIHLARGRFECDASLDFDQISFGNSIHFSGGTLDVKRLRLNLWRFVGTTGLAGEIIGKRIKHGGPRYLKQFDLIAHNLTMTQDDLFRSNCIRAGLEDLLRRILTSRGLSPKEVNISNISVLRCGKLSIAGVAIPTLSFVDDSLSLPEIPFEVRSSLGTTSRGHVATFPSLELSLTPHNSVNKMFVPIVPELSIDLGHDTQITHVEIDPIRQQIQLSARITITPEHTLLKRGISPQHIYQQSSKSFAATCAIDVGHWLTRIGQFTK
jgi:hypothetical protein